MGGKVNYGGQTAPPTPVDVRCRNQTFPPPGPGYPPAGTQYQQHGQPAGFAQPPAGFHQPGGFSQPDILGASGQIIPYVPAKPRGVKYALWVVFSLVTVLACFAAGYLGGAWWAKQQNLGPEAVLQYGPIGSMVLGFSGMAVFGFFHVRDTLRRYRQQMR
ncbi:hypothetical protein [Fodinicola feengrottensis]|uniref:hypothetical protein n=1 Tax=Fodinicola feengrottensis TaxID=435914 RepID=UPI0013D71C53|nr:hypothetical protein [Fodinicola feengrottensis]